MKPAFRTRCVDTAFSNVIAPKHATPAFVNITFQHNGRRRISSSQAKEKPAAVAAPSMHSVDESISSSSSESAIHSSGMPALAVLPLSQVLRTYLITSISSSPMLLSASTSLLRRMLNSRNPLFRIDTNPLMRAILWETFYKQFCAGETEAQVSKVAAELRQQGYAGVILEYAPEVLDDSEGNEIEDVAFWRKGMLDSVQIAAPGDFLGLKWSGMGPMAMRRMKANQEPTERMSEAMHALCSAAAEKGVSLLPAAEESWTLTGFHKWSLDMQRAYNLGGKSVVYTTHQAYLKQCPGIVAQQLAMAKKEGFTLGLKIVRGAYLATENRSLIHDDIESTHACYDGIAAALIHRKYNDTVQAVEGEKDQSFPVINVVLATHNAASVEKAQNLRTEQAARKEELTPLKFAQLQGMADEVSCRLIADAKANIDNPKAVKEEVFKCATWGPVYDCLNYLLRRAAENKDAAGRTHETRAAMQSEIWRRMKRTFGLAA